MPDAADQQGQELVTPASAYSEALVAFARVDRTADARKAIVAMGIRIAILDATVSERAAALRARHGHVRLSKAMVWATAIVLDARLLTYDKRLERYAAPRSTD